MEPQAKEISLSFNDAQVTGLLRRVQVCAIDQVFKDKSKAANSQIQRLRVKQALSEGQTNSWGLIWALGC